MGSNHDMSTLSAPMRRAIADAAPDGTLMCGRHTEDALIRRGLAEPTFGDVKRTNRYSRTTQTVYNVRTGARLKASAR